MAPAFALLSLLLALPAAAAESAPEMTSLLAPSVLRSSASAPSVLSSSASEASAPPLLRSSAAGVPELWLAQRSIDREWGPSDDSLYRVVEVPEWKREGLAMAMSAAVPGTGQLYVGERSGWIFLVVEALGWAGRVVTRQRGDDLAAEAAALVGDPTVASSGWTFDRYQASTGRDPQELRVLWEKDRDAYYELLSRSDDYRFGFSGSDPLQSYDDYRSVHESSQDRYQRSRYADAVLWVNHVVAAFDALRAARNHNLPLRRDLELKVGGKLRPHNSELRATLVRRF
jgi:hypothetical protein